MVGGRTRGLASKLSVDVTSGTQLTIAVRTHLASRRASCRPHRSDGDMIFDLRSVAFEFTIDENSQRRVLRYLWRASRTSCLEGRSVMVTRPRNGMDFSSRDVVPTNPAPANDAIAGFRCRRLCLIRPGRRQRAHERQFGRARARGSSGSSWRSPTLRLPCTAWISARHRPVHSASIRLVEMGPLGEPRRTGGCE